ncbi:MAG: GNAT family N-acetyltransferase [Candidatus Hydrogenedentes bacterium]|nr:GNAT family N-acetyltransferase [Candidatus Hydrogenedentota bacterium]
MRKERPAQPIDHRQAALDEILALREALIIRGTERPVEYPGDREDATVHFGAFAGARNVACASFFLNEWFAERAYQLRGMATDPVFQGRGVGRALLEAAEKHFLQHTPARQLWCSARVPAIGFYLALGWSLVSDEYDVANVGPHRKMCKRLY